VKILIIKLGALGDVVMATPIIRQIQRHHGNAAICLLTTPPYAALFKHWQDLSVQSMERPGPGNLLRMIRWVRAERIERVYDLQSNDRSAILCALSGIRERAGNHPRYPYTLHPPDPYLGQCHIFDRHNQLLASAGIEPAEPQPWLPLSAAEEGRVARWIAGHGMTTRQFVLLHAGTSPRRPEKRWPYFGEIGQRLSAAGFVPIWLGAKPDRELNKTLAARCGIDATSAFDLLELAALGRHAAFALTNDSGPMHVLSCAGIPVYACFGPSDPRRNHALGQGQRVLRPADGSHDLARLSADEVWDRLSNDGRLSAAG
jgi:ADP-heptose:LPS heptosyltransferase